jgi:anion-transporting  ArsA/GET3 family ATPase
VSDDGSGRRGGARSRAASSPLARLLDANGLVVICGSGGVGKTTVAAALGAGVADRTTRKVLVLTVDPARRLATALGLDRSLGNVPVRVNAASGPGQLWMAMLDTKQSWDALVRRHAPDAATREAILGNSLYKNFTGKFIAAHDYIAAERLHELDATGDWDLIVVDTPPSRHALDFLEAPGRMAEFFGSRLLRWLTVPYRSKVFNFASKPFLAVADRVLGAQFLSDIAEFFILFQTMERGFVARARAVERTLRAVGTTFVVVSTLEHAPAAEAEVLARELRRRKFALGAVVANRVLPADLVAPETKAAAEQLRSRLGPLATEVAGALGEGQAAAPVASVLGQVLAGYRNLYVAVSRQAAVDDRLAAMAPFVAHAPLLDREITDLDGLVELAHTLGG